MSPEFYSPLRAVHIVSVAVSISLFVIRGGLMLVDSPTLHTRLWRTLPHVADTLLLASGIGLVIYYAGEPLEQVWLQAKLTLLFLYVVTGAVAITYGRTRVIRAGAFVVALLIVAAIIMTAMRRTPLGL